MESLLEAITEGTPMKDILEGIENVEDELDIVAWYLNHPQFCFAYQNSSSQPEICKAIMKFVELTQWENAVKLVPALDGIVSIFDRNYGGLNEDDTDDGGNIISIIVDNMTDFSYVDAKGIKLVDMIFRTYLREIHRFQVEMGKKLIEHGAEKEALMIAFFDVLERKGYSHEIHGRKKDIWMKMLEKMVDTGIDLECTYEQVVLKERVYLAAAEFQSPKLMKEVVQRGVDIFINFDSSTKKSSIEYSMKTSQFAKLSADHFERTDNEECLEIILKELMKKGQLAEQKIQVTLPDNAKTDFQKERRLIDYLVENGNGAVLGKLGFFPKTPTNLSVSSSGLSCDLKWECREQGEYPVSGYTVQIMQLTQGQNQLKRIKELLEETPIMREFFKVPDLVEEFDMTAKIVFQENWKTVKTLFYKETELGEALEDLPVVDTQIERILQDNPTTGVWKTVYELVGVHQTQQTVSLLQQGSVIKFRVFAENENGSSDPPVESDFLQVKAKLNKPGRPNVDLGDGAMKITWTESEKVQASAITQYRVEGLKNLGQWVVIGKVSALYEKKLEIFKHDELGLSAVRVIALNEDEESEPSDPYEI